MSETSLPRKTVVLGKTKGKLVRLSYLSAHEAKLNTQSGKMEKSVVILIPKENAEDIAEVKGFLDQVKQEVYKANKKNLPPKWWNPLRDGDNDVKQDGSPYGAECHGHFVLSAKADPDKTVDVVNTTRDANGKFVRIGKDEIKSGDWARVQVNLYSYTKGDHGVGAGLMSIQLVKEGDPLGSTANADAAFGEFDDDEDVAF